MIIRFDAFRITELIEWSSLLYGHHVDGDRDQVVDENGQVV